VALRELSGNQLFVVRSQAERHEIRPAGISDDVQSTLRADPEAFLARSVIVCKGASEVGLVRGLDQCWAELGHASFAALGGAYVDVGGSNPDRCYTRGSALLRLGYRVLVLVDADKPPTPDLVAPFHAAGGLTLTWRAGRALEDELFCSMSDAAIDALVAKAQQAMGRDLIAQHILSKSEGRTSLETVEHSRLHGGYTPEIRELLGRASRIRNNGWFKSVTAFQDIGRAIVGPQLQAADAGFREIIGQLWRWTRAA
jgi:hypothetical protein